MNVIVRRAEPRDVPRMLELVRELAVFERAPNEVTVTLEHMLDSGFGPDRVWVGWVAEVPVVGSQLPVSTASEPNKRQPTPDTRILGMAVCYERYSTWKGRRLYLEDIIVTESARGQRVGEKIFRACAAYAHEKGHDGMTWQVLDWNQDAVRFYKRFGATFSREWWNGSVDREQLKNIAEE